MNEGRRCALPGCYVVIEPGLEGRPQRKYCTAAHRAVARQMRREGANRSASAPPLPLQTPRLPLPPLASAPEARTGKRHKLVEATARRARAVAVLGSAGLMVVGGGGLMVASAPPSAPGPLTATPWLAADPRAEQQWAHQATVSLASLDTQLQEVDQAEQSWNALPAAERGEQPPPTVRALSERKALLQQQRTTVASELAAWQSMHEVKTKLSKTDDHVASLDRAIAEVPKQRTLTPAESEASRRLSEQRSMRARQRESQRQELEGLRDGVREAMSTPLPGDDRATKSITSTVKELVKYPGRGRYPRPRDPLDGQAPQPEITAPRERDQRDRQDVGNSAPPNPGRARPQLPGRSDVLAAPPAAGGNRPGGGLLDRVGKGSRVGGAPRLPGTPRIGGAPAAPVAPASPKAPAGSPGSRSTGVPGAKSGPLGGTLDTAGKPGKSLGGLARPGREPRSANPNAGRANPNAGRANPNAGGATGPVGKPLDGVTDTAGSITEPAAESTGPRIPRQRSPRSAPGVSRSVPVVPQTSGDNGSSPGPARSDRAGDSAVSTSRSSGGLADLARAAAYEQSRREKGSRSSGSRSLESIFDSKAGDSASRSSSGERRSRSSSSRGNTEKKVRAEMAREVMKGIGFSGGSSKSGDSKSSRSAKSSDNLSRMMERYQSSGSDRKRSSKSSRSDSDSKSKSSGSSRSRSSNLSRMIERYSGESSDSDSDSGSKRYKSSKSKSKSDSDSGSKRYKSSKSKSKSDSGGNNRSFRSMFSSKSRSSGD